MSATPRVGIAVRRFSNVGGIQTCLIELIAGLNQMSIVPDIVWDEPQDWQALLNPGVSAGFCKGRLAISSRALRKIPAWLGRRLSGLRMQSAGLGLEHFDFVYSFAPSVRMPIGLPNLCYVGGPPYVRMPNEGSVHGQAWHLGVIGTLVHQAVVPLVPLDPNSRYVAFSQWVADLFWREHGCRFPVVWPPARSRRPPEGLESASRSGFLFLSRLEYYKNPFAMLSLARHYSNQPVTIAGATDPSSFDCLTALRAAAGRLGLRNVTIIPNPPEDQVAALLRTHQVFVFPGRWEHFGIVTVEAIQAGLLPLVHNSGGQREIVPLDSLRFEDETELLQRADEAIAMPPQRRDEIMRFLTKHAERGTATRYRTEMLRYLRDDLGLGGIDEECHAWSLQSCLGTRPSPASRGTPDRVEAR